MGARDKTSNMNSLRLMRSLFVLLPLGFAAPACDTGVVGEEPDTAADDDGGEPADCDPMLVCGEALTCVDGSLYPTTCGPDNCDAPTGSCEDDPGEGCDPDLACGEAETCVDGQLYPTTCGPENCDKPIGDCKG